MFKLCLFDLDQTLLYTQDLEHLRKSIAHRQLNDAEVSEYKRTLEEEIEQSPERLYYDVDVLEDIRREFPNLKLGVFTRSPKLYAVTVLEIAYPNFYWDTVISYDDVTHTKPSGEGIETAMNQLKISDPNDVILVGDNHTDIQSAYNAGANAVLDRTSWPANYEKNKQYHGALNSVADFEIEKVEDLLVVLRNPNGQRVFMDCDQELDRESNPEWVRAVYHYSPYNIFGPESPHRIYTLGRYFTDHPDLLLKRSSHAHSSDILKLKDASEFPERWVKGVRATLEESFFEGKTTYVAVIPHRPGRYARLESFLDTVKKDIEHHPLADRTIHFVPDLFYYDDEALSNSKDHLSRERRFYNVMEHLHVNQNRPLENDCTVLIIDDVVTSGATHICASKALHASAAHKNNIDEIINLSFAQTVRAS